MMVFCHAIISLLLDSTQASKPIEVDGPVS